MNEDDYSDNEDYGFDFEPSSRDVEIKQDLLTLKLFREAILKQNPDDPIMADFAEYVLPNLLKVAIGVTAKGGKWIDKKLAEGIKSNRAIHDQSLNTHLLNGLFPANLIERRLQQLDTTAKRIIRETERRILIASFILHDFEKFDYNRFPEMPEKYRNIERIRDLSIEEHKGILDVIIRYLRLDYLINPSNYQFYREYLDDLLFITYNTQTRWDTNWNLSEYNGLKPKLRNDKLLCLVQTSCLADRLSSIVKHPQDALNSGLNHLIDTLSDGQLKLTYHQISENRGVLTNIVNNTLIDEYVSFNTSEHQYYQPLLYLPTGVIYLTQRQAPPINADNIPQRVVDKIKILCSGELQKRQTGFNRDGKGIKYADYYHLFFSTVDLMKVGIDATLNILKNGKTPVTQSRSDNLIKFQKQNVLSSQYNFEFKDDMRIDQLAEFGDLISRKIWDEKVKEIEQVRKKDKEKNIPQPPSLSLIEEVAKLWHLAEHLPAISELQNINESLKQNKLKGNTGGVPYQWYYLAAKYLEINPGIEDVRPICENVVAYITQLIKPYLEQYNLPDGWDDLRLWVKQVVMLPSQTQESSKPDKFLEELNLYQLAKKSGRGKQLICSISHSAYSVTEQMESAVLFTPQVYTNKQNLGGSNAKRNISSIAGIELMLRQILMSQTQANGARFEDAKYRYLYFYPTYYCTPETNLFLHKIYEEVRQTRFDAGVRNHFISRDSQADFALVNYQSIDLFKMDDESKTKIDKTFKLSYPENQTLTFYFMALPPEVKGTDKKPTDTESWVMPAWLAFAFPLILDVKTVVSESPIPLFNDGSQFPETVFLDSSPQAFRILTGTDRFRLDYILEGWTDQETKKRYCAPLNVLTSAYAIHLDVNAKQGKNGYAPNWGELNKLARDIETSPLYIFHFLKDWTRQQKLDTPSINKIKLYAYYFYPCFDPYVAYNSNQEELIMSEQSALNHPKKLTELFRKFYRAKSTKGVATKANAILKPIDEAADVILKADNRVFHGEVLVQAVAAKLFKLMERVHNSTAEGRWIMASRSEEREAILEFAKYFVVEIFEESFSRDRARLAGRQLNLLRDTCEFLYRLENDKEYRDKKAKRLTEQENNEEE